MSRLAGMLFLATATGAALFLFHIKYQVQGLEDELRTVHRDILHHQEAIQVLRTEWSYLSQPARLAELASRHLGLRPLSADQIVRLDDLPLRAETPDDAPAAGPATGPVTGGPGDTHKAGATR